MKNMVWFLALLLLPALAFGKNKKKKTVAAPAVPKVHVGNITTYYSTRETILSNPILTTDSVGCSISGFTVSLEAPGHDFFGPLYVNGATMSDVQKGKIKEWDFPKVTVYIQDIHLNCNGQDVRATPFTIIYNY